MNLVAISCVKNEEDIIETFIRHTATFVDQIVILDNGSTDATLDILNSIKTENIALELLIDSSIGHFQWKRMNFLMDSYAVNKYAGDWIIPLDADEFIVAEDKVSFCDILSSHKSPVKLQLMTYVPHESDDRREINPALRIRHRLQKEAHPYYKVIVPSDLLKKRPDVSLSQGNHNLVLNGKHLKAFLLDSVFLAHIPIRSPEQYASKVALKNLQYLAMSQREESWGGHLQRPYELLKKDPQAFADTYREAALYFGVKPDRTFEPKVVLDPIPYHGGDLRYTRMSSENHRVFKSIITYAEHLAASYADLSLQYDKLLRERENKNRITKIVEYVRTIFR